MISGRTELFVPTCISSDGIRGHCGTGPGGLGLGYVDRRSDATAIMIDGEINPPP